MLRRRQLIQGAASFASSQAEIFERSKKNDNNGSSEMRIMRDVRVSDENNVKGNTDVEAHVSDGVEDDEMIGSV